jgi:hypothetical protein
MVYPKHQIDRGYPSESGVQMRPKEKVKTVGLEKVSTHPDAIV